MTPKIPENHTSYRAHRRQVWLQIYLPAFLIFLIGVASATLLGLRAFGEGDQSQRWAAISTIWLVIPLMLSGVLFFAVLVMFIYMIGRLLKIIPPYTGKAQYYVHLATQKTRYAADLLVRPVLFMEGIVASIRSALGRK